MLVRLTPEGRRFAEGCAAEIGRRVIGLTDHLSAAQRAQLTQLATALVGVRPVSG
ncbi:hypothetical protein [Nonomuraea sp. NPDC049158]|uniref:hypothetical protein n=1 Tax=Nonomuraea sp. NPDC049158 TaxID=3155649 RepID=UPI0033CD6994